MKGKKQPKESKIRNFLEHVAGSVTWGRFAHIVILMIVAFSLYFSLKSK